jgi:hypothetical protein
MSIEKVSPWCRPTLPSFMADIILLDMYAQIREQKGELPEDPDDRSQILKEMTQEYWCAQVPEEYWFTRRCLRGGRTECRRTLLEIDYEAGERIKYIDVVSQYPGAQIKERYPVGYPRIEVYDSKHYPCSKHSSPTNKDKTPNKPELFCGCSLARKKLELNPVLEVVEKEAPHPNVFDLDESYFGFVCVTVYLPKESFVPFLVHYDERRKKCIAANGFLKEEYFCSEELKLAMRLGRPFGARIIKFHRMDVYRSREGLWNRVMKRYYIMKLKNSGPKPPQDLYLSYAAQYRQLGMEDIVLHSLRHDEWGDFPAKKFVAKIALNCGWGKHAQRPIMQETVLFDPSYSETLRTLFMNHDQGNIKMKSVQLRQDSLGIATFNTLGKTSRQFHHLYLPAACMVPSYGRMMFLRKVMELKDPERQLLMHDTDSMMYYQQVGDPELETGTILAEWEEEKVSKEGIIGYVSIGPKSYAIITRTGREITKMKGVSIRQAHDELLNYEKMKSLVMDPSTTILMPQFSFVGTDQISTFNHLKQVRFNTDEVKGVLKPSANGQGHTIYPFFIDEE